jgi:hypothetical protein
MLTVDLEVRKGEQLQRCCACRTHPCSSGGMFVFVENSAQTLASSDVQTDDLARIVDRRRTQRVGAEYRVTGSDLEFRCGR